MRVRVLPFHFNIVPFQLLVRSWGPHRCIVSVANAENVGISCSSAHRNVNTHTECRRRPTKRNEKKPTELWFGFAKMTATSIRFEIDIAAHFSPRSVPLAYGFVVSICVSVWEQCRSLCVVLTIYAVSTSQSSVRGTAKTMTTNMKNMFVFFSSFRCFDFKSDVYFFVSFQFAFKIFKVFSSFWFEI